ncbi:MAG: lyase family protein [Xanthobacteraceae bacterium]
MRAILDDRARLQRMLDFEVALARAEAAVGVIPALATDAIAAAARAERYDLKTLAQTALVLGTIATPVIEALTSEVAKSDAAAAFYVNWGASPQDLTDTALVLELRAACDALINDLSRAIDAFMALAGRHRRTSMVARVALQHTLPIPFGLKVAGCAAALARSRDRLRRLRREALVLQFGGTAGTLSALNERALDVSERLAALLGLPLPDAPWHSHRDRLAEVASAFAILCGTCGKIGRDSMLLMQTEVGEAAEPARAVEDGAAPLIHTRSPNAAAIALSAAAIAPSVAAGLLAAQGHEHEGGVSGSSTEWLGFSMLMQITSGAVDATARIAEGLEIDSERMRVNLAMTRGQVMADAVSLALGAKLGKAEAHGIVAEASRKARSTKRELQDVLAEDDRVILSLSVGELAKLFEPMASQGAAQLWIDHIAASVQGRKR